jgi:hypothetical protein
MHIYKKLYCDVQTKPHTKKILRKIKYHGGLAKVYVIAVACGNDYFEIIPGYVLKQKAYPVKELHIIGLAGDYDSAVELIQQMLSDFEQRYHTYWFKNLLMQEKEMNFTGYSRK